MFQTIDESSRRVTEFAAYPSAARRVMRRAINACIFARRLGNIVKATVVGVKDKKEIGLSERESGLFSLRQHVG